MKRLIWYLGVLVSAALILGLFACGGSPAAQEPQAPEQTAPPALSGPPKIPHALDSRDNNCISCHTSEGNGIGVPGGLGVPPNHAGRTSDTCKACHQPG